eukprot:SAG31_NODE_16183_length_719_cov_5.175806_1_plen_64_part_01
MWLIIQPCTPKQTTIPDLHTRSTSTCSPVPAVPVPEQYLAVPAPEYSQLCTPTAQRHNVIGTTY